MKSFACMFAGLLILGELALLGCGSSRQLKSITVSPATADAKSFPNGQVPFTATGTYSKPPSPSPLTSNDVQWCVGSSSGACDGNIFPGATVDSNGVAQCGGVFTGTAFVLAGTEASVKNPDGGQQFKIFGSAQITCP
ncbi:MAG TPA: hypothetical protein VGS78_04580 [Candidatus Sulfotelmatobacter sp.]|nr:hypothetical protein [Candidatus Sulfotelmatobacter sp.]